MKKILGLDLGTNSIGWAVIEADEISNDDKIFLKPARIVASNSRIIPLDAAILGDFDKGNSISQTSERTSYRGTRRLKERSLLRRERLHRVLDVIGFLPKHFSEKLTRYGKFIDDSEPKLAWYKDDCDVNTFLFQESFNEMLSEFTAKHININKIPYDWTIYYLRKKALSKPITKEELAWILLNFNQKRGYYQLRGEEEEVDKTKDVKFYALKVLRVEVTNDKKGKDTWYNVYLENGMIYRRASSTPLEWEGKIKEFIVTTDINEDGTPKTDKEGNIKRSFRSPKEDDWGLLKIKTEADIETSNKTVGCYIFDSLLENPTQKIKGKLIRTIERKFYKEELRQILEVQKEFIPELKDRDLYTKCIEELYPINEAHRNNIAQWDFTSLFINDIIFYQRPLKSKKSLISDCPYESYFYNKKDNDGNCMKDENGNDIVFEQQLKCIAKSHPLFQEFRLWQFVQNLKIYQREKEVNGKLCTDVDVTSEFIKTEEDIVAVFEWLNDRKEIDQKEFLKYPPFGLKKDAVKFRWNYVEDKKYPCNETKALILSHFKKANIDTGFLNYENIEALWHILYSVEDKFEIKSALGKYAEKHSLSDSFIEEFSKVPPFKKEYGSYSAKAVKKLLSLMRMGKYWNEEDIDNKTKERIDKIINGEYDENIKIRVREKASELCDISQFKGLPLWLACYVVYDRHSEAKEITKWEKPEDIDEFLKNFKQHSLRNPIVEQVILETLRTVRDIWKQVGDIDEIHIELAREMKNPADKRKLMSAQILENENTNLRIKAILEELKNPEHKVDNVRPYSPTQQEIFKIYEEYAVGNITKDDNDFDFISQISKKAQPTKSEIIRYKAWLEQKYQSPYTGQFIPLSKLFTAEYEIEHIIPQSRYFDDSFSNKVICESVVNKNPYKDNQLGYEFIKKNSGRIVDELSTIGKTVKIFTVEEYERFVKDHYSHNRIKMSKLLMEDIPDKFIERQLNDSRYISKYIKGLLSNIVREKDVNGEYEQEAVSKNLITCNGTITDRLKKDWGMNDVWNRIVLPRFERLNEITGTTNFTQNSTEGHSIPSMPLELQKGFNKKRIDHRHHAMDAIVIACTTREHVNLLNNEAAHSKHNANRYQLSYKLRRREKVRISNEEKEVFKEFFMPWDTFPIDVQNTIENMIVSFKQNLRVVNKTTNKYEHYNENGKKVLTNQTKGDNWAIRKPMHKETVFGEINLRKIKKVKLSSALDNPKAIVDKDIKKKVLELQLLGKTNKEIIKYFETDKDTWSDIASGKVKVYYFTNDTNDRYFATRKFVDSSFDEKKIKEQVTDTGIQKILLAHLAMNDNNPELAFSADGIDEMNKNIVALNNGKFHQPIIKVRVYEKADKFAVGEKGNKNKKFVEAAKGTNLYFAIYTIEKEDKKNGKIETIRTYATVPLNMVIDCQKKAGKEWKNLLDSTLKECNYIDKDASLLFILSPNDLVYLPTEDEIRNNIFNISKDRIYKIVSFTGNRLYAIPYTISKSIVDKVEYTQLNKVEFTDYKESIKEICLPIKVDRLGNIIEFNGMKKQ